MEYLFYGSENANVTAVSQEYPGIRTPLDLYDVLSGVWCEYTCAPRLRLNYPLKHVTWGQCSITSFLVQDIFGGKVYGIPRPGGTFHCYNDVDGHVFDITSEQFEGEALKEITDCLEEYTNYIAAQTLALSVKLSSEKEGTEVAWDEGSINIKAIRN